MSGRVHRRSCPGPADHEGECQPLFDPPLVSPLDEKNPAVRKLAGRDRGHYARVMAAVEQADLDRLTHGYGEAAKITVRQAYKLAVISAFSLLPWSFADARGPAPGSSGFDIDKYAADVARSAGAFADALIAEDQAAMLAFLEKKPS